MTTEGKYKFQYQIDDEDWIKIKELRWCASVKRGRVYISNQRWNRGRVEKKYLHRYVLGYVGPLEVDHINNDPTDNRKSNLRICTRLQNSHNSKTSSSNTSGMRGVCWDKENQKWKVRLKDNGKEVWLGRYSDYSTACAVMERAIKENRGEYARIR